MGCRWPRESAIRPQSDRGSIAGSENANHAGLADVAMNFAAKLGVGVQVLPPGGHFAVKQIDEMWDLHGEQLRDKRTNSTPRL
jgi:hypothetical protein